MEGARPVQRIALASLSLIAVALATVTVASTPQTEPVAAQEKSTEQPVPAVPSKHTVEVTVSGPYDTVMHVSRAGAQTEVELQGEPFEFEFTETLAHVGSLGITVRADSADPSGEPLRCAIRVDGVTVADDAQTGTGKSGTARVHCMIPLDI
ncbi:hypothetical protein SAMN05216266_102314 [Amycolatopsis marina]|uniref:MmpS family membrane protein n=2 Tax=Amycolatopsis marina TaxID=490629 RepID=A0A1I0WYX2_9PSEU|nr:hypothetical protein SAMN05216266_102314 [Amycolatopsis marina]